MSYSLPSPGSQQITLATAVEMTTRFREHNNGNPATATTGGLCNSETFNLQDVAALVNTTGAAAIRIYYGMDEHLDVHAILVAVDEEGNDILPSENTRTGTDPILIIEQGIRCPPTCPDDSPLNS